MQHFIDRLEAFARCQGASVVRTRLDRRVSGHVERGHVVLRASLSKEQQVLTLVHELTHLMVHSDATQDLNRTVCEYEAQAVEQWVGVQLGLLGYAGDADVSAITDDLLACSVERVRRVAGTLLKVLEGEPVAPLLHRLEAQASVEV